MYCKTCGAQLVAGAATCVGCGAILSKRSTSTVCRACGHPATSGAQFCKKCGASLEQVRASAAAAAASPASSAPQHGSITVQPVQAPDEDRCPHCGAVTRTVAKFCKSCGKPTVAALAPPVAPLSQGRLQTVPEAANALVEGSAGPAAKPSQAPLQVPRLGASPTHPVIATQERRPSTTSKPRPLLVAALIVVVALAAGVTYMKIRSAKLAGEVTASGAAPGLYGSGPLAPPNTSAISTNSASPAQTAGAVQANQSSDAQTFPQETQVPSGGSEPQLAAPSPTQSWNRSGTPGSQPGAPASPAYQQAHTNAEQAFAAAQYIDPPNNSALYWARMAAQQGDPSASQTELQVLEQMKATVQAQRASRNYDSAVMLLSRLMQLFPDRTELQQMGSSIGDEQQAYNRQLEQQRKADEFKAQTKEFRLQHKHFMGLQNQNLNPAYGYCQGIMRVTPDGTARFDCTQADARGRCDHLVFTGADIKDLQLKNNGMLHLALRSGNVDFMADPTTIQAAADALRRLGHK